MSKIMILFCNSETKGSPLFSETINFDGRNLLETNNTELHLTYSAEILTVWNFRKPFHLQHSLVLHFQIISLTFLISWKTKKPVYTII